MEQIAARVAAVFFVSGAEGGTPVVGNLRSRRTERRRTMPPNPGQRSRRRPPASRRNELTAREPLRGMMRRPIQRRISRRKRWSTRPAPKLCADAGQPEDPEHARLGKGRLKGDPRRDQTLSRCRKLRSRVSSTSDLPPVLSRLASVSQRIQAPPRRAWASRLFDSSGRIRITAAIEALSRR
jgi:hypothetical protein